MQPLPYYQSTYPNTVSYSSNPSYSTHGSPVPSSVMTSTNPMIPQPNMSSLAHPVGTTAPGIPNETAAATPAAQPPKRKQVKNACTNCQKACKKCDDARPCPRCIKYGIADTCVNSVRKERKKGIKRGPYKRRQKDDASSSSSTRKADDPSMAGQQQNPYAAAMRPPMPYSPYTMNQYGQPTYDPYGSYAAAYHKDHMMPQSYVVNPMYSSLGYQMFMPTGASGSDSQQQQQSPQQSSAAPATAAATTPSAYQHYVGYMQHHQQPTSRYGDHLVHSQQQQQQQPSHQGSGSSSPAATHLYYQQPPQAQQQQQQPTRLSPQLPDIKSESHSSSPVAPNAVPGSFMKSQAMTPIPSASTSSGTTASPAEPNEDDETKYARLPQLCNVALQNSAVASSSNDQSSSNTASPTHPQQHS